jgi:hypothetical protein
MSFYEHIMRKDEEEEGENYLYIVHTPLRDENRRRNSRLVFA